MPPLYKSSRPLFGATARRGERCFEIVDVADATGEDQDQPRIHAQALLQRQPFMRVGQRVVEDIRIRAEAIARLCGLAAHYSLPLLCAEILPPKTPLRHIAGLDRRGDSPFIHKSQRQERTNVELQSRNATNPALQYLLAMSTSVDRFSILLLDDDPIIAMDAAMEIEIWGHECHVAYDLASAMEMLGEIPVHAALLDYD